MKRNEQIVTGLDIGTAAVRAIIAACSADTGIRVLGVGVTPSDGVRKSMITDNARASSAIRAAVEEAERDAHAEVDSVCVNIGGSHIHSGSTDAVVSLKDNEDTVQDSHLQELHEKARGNAAEKGREFLHVIPSEYRLDGHGGNQNPVGAQASRIQLVAHMITADRSVMENHARTVNDAGFKVADLCFSPIAAGHAVLTEQEKKDGVLLVDMGAGSTSYAVYFNNAIYYSKVFAVGGDHLTNDLALGLHLSIPEAEQLKCTYGRLIRINDAQRDPGTVRVQMSDKKDRAILRQDVDLIIDSRIEELLQFICDDIEGQQYRPMLAHGAVFVGGGTQLHRFAERAEKTFAHRVRIGIPHLLAEQDTPQPGAISADRHLHLRDTCFSTALGLVRYGFICLQNSRAQAHGGFRKFIRSVFSLS